MAIVIHVSGEKRCMMMASAGQAGALMTFKPSSLATIYAVMLGCANDYGQRVTLPAIS
ncbi:hypothetical protein [Paenibacillus rigui]|uniref:hypothetical protein n=1 Tax=Paenibacillus rigui TaxID=554312 RepID=UPI0015C622DF|nr:hypothetical protein [Paenibacillus rigui]